MGKKWTFEELRTIALKYKTKGEFKKNNRIAYYASVRSGDHDRICTHMPKYLSRSGKEASRIKWTFENLHAEAFKYTNRIHFVKGNRKAYFAALKRGRKFMDRICSHMNPPLTEAYTDEELYKEASLYKTRVEFRKGNPGAHMAAHRRGKDFWDKVCFNMKPSARSSLSERELFSAIRSIYPNAKKTMDMKVKIDGKPYIHGFEIDILVGNLGIEFDGKYHHTYEYMRADKGKKLWSDADIHNYHKIKDDWFATKGIQILHIKEQDWLDNKDACIQKCLDFLKLSVLPSEITVSIDPAA